MTSTLKLEIPSELVPDVESVVSYLREVGRRPATERDLLQEERTLQLRLNAVGRAAMRAMLASADTQAAEIEIDGATWGNRRLTTGEYETLFGTVSLERSIYQQRGRGRAAVALDLRLGIFEGRYTPATARVLCHAVGLMPEHDAEKFLAEVGVATLSVSTLHRIPRAIAARHETRREIIDRAVREVDRIPDEAVAVQALVDGVMVPQDGEHTGARGRKPKGEAEPPRHEKRYGPIGADSPAANDGEGGRPWHEASVGALHFMTELGEPLHTICLARMPEPRKATLFGQLETELKAVLTERPELDVVLASDGALVHWEELERIAERIRPLMTGRIFFAVDFYHAAEYLTKAAEIVWGAGDAQGAVHAATWREMLLCVADEYVDIDGGISAPYCGHSAMARPVHGLCNAFNHNKDGKSGYSGGSTLNPVWTNLSPRVYHQPSGTTDMFDFAGFDFDGLLGQVVQAP